jgi:hypothetical protein
MNVDARHRRDAVYRTFALDGAEQCSGLPVCRYDAAAPEPGFAPAFSLVAAERDLHRTPAGGGEQAFTYLLLRRAGAEDREIRC